jgi:hypothetical protein
MVHPDFQYKPELVPAMSAMVLHGGYDLVLGSRVLVRGALSGGMPKWKWAVNRSLTALDIRFVENFARIQLHPAPSESGNITLDFVGFHRNVPRQDIRQLRFQFFDVPLAAGQRVERLILNLWSLDVEHMTKSAIRGDDAQMLVEDQQGIADRFHDRLGQGGPFIDLP